MADLALLNKDLEDVVAKRGDLRNKYIGATMPEDARAADIELATRAQKLQVLIEEQKQRDRDAVFEQTAAYIENPLHQIPRAVNADDEGRRLMAKAGWETKGGFVTRMTSMGREIAMYPEEVMFGPMPSSDDPSAPYFKQTRAVMQPEYRSAYVKWLMSRSRSDSFAFGRLTGPEQNALSEGMDTGGGFLVPPDIQAEMLGRTAQKSVMRGISRVQPTARDQLKFPAVAPHASSGSIYSSGFVGGWVGETPAFAENDPSFQEFSIGIKKLRVSTKMSNDWLADAAANVLAFLSDNGAENMALVEDSGFIAGLNTPLQPMGVLNAGITTGDVEGSTSDTISNTTSSAGSAPKITALEYELPAAYANNASWLMARQTEGKIRALVDSNGRPYWLAGTESGYGGTPRSIDSYPVYNSDFMPIGGSNGNKVVVFGDFHNYIIAQRAQISTVILRERFADTDQTGIILFERVGGGVWNTDAFRIGIV